MTRPSFEIAPMEEGDAAAVLAIYAAGIAGGNATFEAAAPAWTDWDAGHLRACRLVARAAEGIIGWAALSPVSGRCVYAGVAEVSIYVAPEMRGAGVGRALLKALITASEAAGLWTLQASIFPENAASIALHESCGFRRVGVRERLARMSHGPFAGRWRDVLLYERRSATVGVR